MRVELDRVSKRFHLEWIIRHLSLSLDAQSRWAIAGPNGSGKSTLLKILSGHLSPTEGTIRFLLDGKPLERSTVHAHISLAAPYIELIEEFTLEETLRFHQRFRSFLNGLTPAGVIDRLGFGQHRKKQLRFFSSGMKQRLKLALAICSSCDLLLLDEPTTNLDQEGAQWYRQLLDDYARDCTLVIASNVEEDFATCTEMLPMLDFKARERSR